MCDSVPQSLTDFSLLSGVGERKLAKYGIAFLAIINNHLANASL
jgi:superfamily II DNA helicase RecQ